MLNCLRVLLLVVCAASGLQSISFLARIFISVIITWRRADIVRCQESAKDFYRGCCGGGGQ